MAALKKFIFDCCSVVKWDSRNISSNTIHYFNRNYHIDAFPKIFYIVSYFLADMLNVTPSFMRYDSWGYKNKTMAHYPGMIGGLETGEIEIGKN